MNLKTSLLMGLGLFGCAMNPTDGDVLRRIKGTDLYLLQPNGYAIWPGAIMQVQAQDQHTGAWTTIGSAPATTKVTQYKQKLYVWGMNLKVPTEPYINWASATARIRVRECDANGASCTAVSMYDRAGADCVYNWSGQAQIDPSSVDAYTIGQSCSKGRTEVLVRYGDIAPQGPQ
jgi:hypothetical protein